MKKRIERVILISLGLNIILTIIKLSFGYFGNSSSLTSDGFNSLSDVLVSIVLFIFIKVAHKGPDKNHPYGHEKYEALVYFILGMVLLITGFTIGFDAVKSFHKSITNDEAYVMPHIVTLYAAIFSVIVKLILFKINNRTAKKYDSPSLKADALNHLFDIIATSFSVISIIFALFGLWYIEYIASVLIGLIIIKTSLSIAKDAISFLVDEAPDPIIIDQIEKTALSVKGVLSVDDLKVRMHVKNLYVDIEISVDRELSLEKAHLISENVHDMVEERHDVIHCMVHVNPKEN